MNYRHVVRSKMTDRLRTYILSGEVQDGIGGYFLVAFRNIWIYNGVQTFVIPEMIGIQNILAVFIGDKVGIILPGADQSAFQLRNEPADVVFRVKGRSLEGGRICADDQIVFADVDGHLFA